MIIKSKNNIYICNEENSSIEYIKIFKNEEGTFYQSTANPADIVYFCYISYGYCLYEVSSTKTFIVHNKSIEQRKHHWEAVLSNGILLKVHDKFIDYGGNILKGQEDIVGFFSIENYFDADYISVKIEGNDTGYFVKVHFSNNDFLARNRLIM